MVYSVVLVSAIHHHESAVGIPMSPPSHLPPHPTPLGCHRASCAMQQLPALSFNSYFISRKFELIIHLNSLITEKKCRFEMNWPNSSESTVRQKIPVASSGVPRAHPHFWLHSVHFSSVVSNSLRPRELQHARPPCPSPIPGVYSNSCPSSWWCHPAISSSVVPFSSCPQSLPTSGSFPVSQLFTSGGQSTGVSASVLQHQSFQWIPRTDLL